MQSYVFLPGDHDTLTDSGHVRKNSSKAPAAAVQREPASAMGFAISRLACHETRWRRRIRSRTGLRSRRLPRARSPQAPRSTRRALSLLCPHPCEACACLLPMLLPHRGCWLAAEACTHLAHVLERLLWYSHSSHVV